MTDDLAPRLEGIAEVLRQWLEWNKGEREDEGLQTGDETHIVALPDGLLPVPRWPTRGQLESWADTMERAAKELSHHW